MSEETQVIVKFTTNLPPPYKVPESDLAVPVKLKRYGLSQIINHLLALEQPRPFDFIIDGSLLRSSLEQHLLEKGISPETVIEVEYTPVVTPPQTTAVIPEKDWVMAVDGAHEDHLVAGRYDGIVNVWTGDSECSCNVAAHEGAVHAVAVVRRSEGRLVLTGGVDQGVRLWRLHPASKGGKAGAAEALAQFVGHADTITSIASSPDGTQACSCSWDGAVLMWRTGPEVLEAAEESKAARVGQKKRKGQAGAAEATVQLAGHEQEPAQRLVGHLHAVTCVCWPEPTTLYTGGWDHSVRQWDAATGINTASYNGSKAINSVAAAPGGGWEVAFGGSDGVLRVWDSRSRPGVGGEGLAVRGLASHTKWVTSVAWSPASAHHVATGAHDGSVKLWDLRCTIPLATVAAHSDKVMCVSWWGAAAIASGGADCKLQVHSMQEAAINADGAH